MCSVECRALCSVAHSDVSTTLLRAACSDVCSAVCNAACSLMSVRSLVLKLRVVLFGIVATILHKY